MLLVKPLWHDINPTLQYDGESDSARRGRCDFNSSESKTFSIKSCQTCHHPLKSSSNPQTCQQSNTYKLHKLSCRAVGKTLLGIHKHQGALPDTLPTNSFMTRVFPVPQAISIFLAPFAQASKQSCWHFLNGGFEGVASSWMPLLEVALLATSLPETAGGCHIMLSRWHGCILAMSTMRALNSNKKHQETICETFMKLYQSDSSKDVKS